MLARVFERSFSTEMRFSIEKQERQRRNNENSFSLHFYVIIQVKIRKREAFAGIFTKYFNRNGGLPWQSAGNDSCGQNVNFVVFQQTAVICVLQITNCDSNAKFFLQAV